MARINAVNQQPLRQGGQGKDPVMLNAQPFTPDYAPNPGQGVAAMAAAQKKANRLEELRVVRGSPAHLHDVGRPRPARGR